MADPRITKLARLLVEHSCQIESGEKVFIEAFDLPSPQLVQDLISVISEKGGVPYVSWKNNMIQRSLFRDAPEESFKMAGNAERALMEQSDAYIGVRGSNNSDELSDVPGSKFALYQEHWWKQVHLEVRVPKTKWVVLRYPTASMAQSAHMSSEAFEDFYFDVCTADYKAMEKAQEPLVARMLAAKDVEIKGPGTDLKFSIANIPVIPCNGRRNIPDGEVFTSPVRDSMNGVIQYNTPSRYQGTVFNNVRFRFENGKIVEAHSDGNSDRLNEILDTDDGARYIGEWAIGCNNAVHTPMLDTLFDEKIGGSFHLTPGNAYETADNGNRSKVHWDLVCIQRPDYGGGEIWFDGEMIRKDGLFLPDDLKGLNPS